MWATYVLLPTAYQLEGQAGFVFTVDLQRENQKSHFQNKLQHLTVNDFISNPFYWHGRVFAIYKEVTFIASSKPCGCDNETLYNRTETLDKQHNVCLNKAHIFNTRLKCISNLETHWGWLRCLLLLTLTEESQPWQAYLCSAIGVASRVYTVEFSNSMPGENT